MPTAAYDDNPTLIVIAAPSIHDPYYAEVFDQIIEYDIQFATAVIGRDKIVVLADKDTMPRLKGRLPADVLLEADVEDIWLRDFAPFSPSRMIQFTYQPRYLDAADSQLTQAGFDGLASQYGLRFERSNLILDGGNLVDHNDKAIVTARVLEDNPQLTRDEIVAALKSALGLAHLAIIPEEEGEATGHSDGMVLWASADTLLVNIYPEPFRTQVLTALSDGLPDVKVVEVEANYSSDLWKDFASACGLNVNAIATSRYFYVPVFGNKSDDSFLATLKLYTDREIVPINAEGVCFMGGSVRCLSWQMTGENAQKLIDAARNENAD